MQQIGRSFGVRTGKVSTEQLTNRYHFCRQAPIVDDVMGTIVEHATDLVRKYDGTYFYIAWLSANEEVKFHATVNCGLLLDVSIGWDAHCTFWSSRSSDS
jgi:hypothetical protein